MDEENPSYYAVIPANVRYDESLKDKAKLLYGEISSLCNKDGYCWASNTYFAELYNLDKTTISRLIGSLEKRKYIKIEIKRNSNKQIEYRHIYIADPLLTKKSIPIDQKINTLLTKKSIPIDQKVKENNKNIIINNNNKREIYKEKNFSPPSLEEIENYIKEKNLYINAKDFYDYFEEGNWIDSRGNKVKNWKQKIQTWARYNTSNKMTIQEKIDRSMEEFLNANR